MRNILYILLLALGGFACTDKECCVFPSGDRIDIFLLENYEKDPDSRYNELSSYRLPTQPLIRYEDILAYDDETFEMTLGGASLQALRDVKTAQPFALTVDRDVIYTGWFWPAFLSSSCNCIVVDPIRAYTDNVIRFQLGYGTAEDLRSIDRRNADIILGTLERDGKLR